MDASGAIRAVHTQPHSNSFRRDGPHLMESAVFPFHLAFHYLQTQAPRVRPGYDNPRPLSLTGR